MTKATGTAGRDHPDRRGRNASPSLGQRDILDLYVETPNASAVARATEK